MTVPEHLARYPTPAAITSLARRFGLPDEAAMQDWPWEVADPSRLDEFLAAYEDAALTEDERFVLMEVLIQCCEDLQGDLDEDPRWKRVLWLLEKNIALHVASVYYWTQDGEGPRAEAFRVAEGLGSVLARHRSEFGGS